MRALPEESFHEQNWHILNGEKTSLNHSFEWLIDPSENLASVCEVSRSFPCLFSTCPISNHNVLIELIIICLSSERTHAWQMNPTWTGHIGSHLMEPNSWTGQSVCMINTPALFANTLPSVGNVSVLVRSSQTHKPLEAIWTSHVKASTTL